MITTPNSETPTPRPKGSRRLFIALTVVSAVAAMAITALLISIFAHKQEERRPFVRLVEVDDNTTDPEVWGKNWPNEFDSYSRTVDVTHTRYGGSEGPIPTSRLEVDPWLKRMFAGYAFALDFRQRRGHGYMLYDQEATKRITERPQPGACLHCHSSVVPTWRRVGLEVRGKTLADANGFDWPAVFAGFEKMSTIPYVQAHAELLKTPDGSVPKPPPANPAPATQPTTREALKAHVGEAHPVSCVDCHDPQNMQLRVTRPAFVRGIQALAASNDPLPHLPTIERWRQGGRAEPYDPNRDATRQEMRAFVCAQCHVEYYCAPKMVMFFPWANGLKVEQIEKQYDNTKFPDGAPFFDFKHAETGAPIYKAQHPEFEMWSQGIHARSGVACADCHMPYKREGAMKVTDHWVRSPLLMINRACQPCHNFPETEMADRVLSIQQRTHALMDRGGKAVVDMLDAVKSAKAAGATEEQLKPVYALQRQAQWRLDFVNAENSMGFHAPQEAARILGEAIDFARQGQIAAQNFRTAPTTQAAR
jgi:nitrite reductase (cytochrome c-552)